DRQTFFPVFRTRHQTSQDNSTRNLTHPAKNRIYTQIFIL
ncbi:MAG: hypothetical protein AVDCRST_MAG56-3779, partial [uncultured Cytophagales bacterium]